MKRIATGILFVLASIGAAASPAAADSWTSYTSEEKEPRVCTSGRLVTGFGCSGDHCDNVRLRCGTSTFGVYARYWTAAISEEDLGISQSIGGQIVRHLDNMQKCGTTGFITGIDCQGGDCDNLSLECTLLSGRSRTSCSWTSWVSEENGGTLTFPTGRYAAGMECSGSRCDNKRFYICAVSP